MRALWHLRVAQDLALAEKHIEEARNCVIKASQYHGLSKQDHDELQKFHRLLWADNVEVKASGNGRAWDFGQTLMNMAKD